jgi:Spherulation-specific family 4
MKTSFLSTLSLAALGAATQVLLPLYIYPLTGVWDPVYDAIAAYPDLLFRVIVNVDSGPGGDGEHASIVQLLQT